MLSIKATRLFKAACNIGVRICYSGTVMSPNPLNNNNLVWIDMEMTGLDENKDQILEIACIVTDSHLNIIAEGPNIVIHHDDSILNSMNAWCIHHHNKTGLTQASRDSTINLETAENTILEFISKYAPKNRCPLAGNSVYMDRLFLRKYMPKINDHLHYRIVDVSAIKELSSRWFYKEHKNVPRKEFAHRALTDIKESIKELQFYKDNIFRSSS